MRRSVAPGGTGGENIYIAAVTDQRRKINGKQIRSTYNQTPHFVETKIKSTTTLSVNRRRQRGDETARDRTGLIGRGEKMKSLTLRSHGLMVAVKGL